jgi:cold shock CspA family protein
MATTAPATTAPATTASASTAPVTSGRVKWFNNKAGYGFITVNDCETNEERDIFVHHSEIKVEQTQYKYLVQGEYIEFVIGAIARENNIDAHATSVRGINGGKLMCETRNEVRSYRTGEQPRQTRPAQAQQGQAQQQPRQAQQGQAEQGQATQQPRQATQQQTQTRQPRQDQRRPQLEKADQTEWMVVPRRRTETTGSRPVKQRQPAIEIAN